jgi:hypothetical protein
MSFLSFIKSQFLNKTKSNYESNWIVKLSKNKIFSIDYDGLEEELSFNEIDKIIIETNDSGPWNSDVLWKIYSKDKLLIVPLGCSGESLMLEKFQSFLDFDNEKFIEAMTSTENNTFLF